jgi:hypothetical protein
LQGALEKRDAEELSQLLQAHEQNLLKARRQSVQWEIDAANDTLDGLNLQKAAAEYRRDHYTELLQAGLSAPETIQMVTTQVVSTLHEIESVVQLVRAVLSLVPQVGAPTAMKYGGMETSGAAAGFASASQAIAEGASAEASSAAMQATFQRRDQEWKHQIELANRDIAPLEKQIAAAGIRLDIATASLDVHDKTIDQAEEKYDFLRDKFTSFGLYTWLSAQLQKLHRQAVNSAMSIATLAQQAYLFDHPDELAPPVLEASYFEAGHSGLLAGERLLLDLYDMERRYIEANTRKFEIEQSFSLARFAPDALNSLKTTSTCMFTTPEWFFDLTYPGHYRRRIRGVRLTLPCVVGPDVNVGVTLRMTSSRVRKDRRFDSAVTVPLRGRSVIATSQAQNDSGVFDFSFRDERYLPFEGAGVDSEWTLTLPKTVRAFDYSTITDVILRISYVAEEDDGLRTVTESVTAGVINALAENGIVQTWDLRTDFPAAWNQLAAGPGSVTIDISERHVPFLLSPFSLEQATFELLTLPTDRSPELKLDPLPSDGGVKPPPAAPAAPRSDGLILLSTSPAPSDIVGSHVIDRTSDAGSVGNLVLRVVMKPKTD